MSTEGEGADRPRIDRRGLGRALSRIADASVADALALLDETDVSKASAWRCGITGPAGAGKSSLVGRFAAARLARGRRVGVVAIDPTSPVSQGAILGDRIRIDAHGDDENLFVRSLASRRSLDGLADNLANVMALLADRDFDDVLVETVGAGQSQYEIRQLADTVIVVLMPGAGDAVQAVKAGILECGDVYVVNKGDLPGAKEMVSEIESVVAHGPRADGWQVPVVLVSALSGDGVEALDEAAEAHRRWCETHRDAAEAGRRRLRSHVRALVQRRLAELMERPELVADGSVRDTYARVVAALGHDGEGDRGDESGQADKAD